MDTRKIRKLIELVKETGIGELEVTSNDESVRISCQSSIPAPMPQQVIAATPAATTTAPAAGPTEAPAPANKPAEIDGHHIKSPMVGTAYLAPTPGAKPFDSVGQHIEVGDTLCLIEAMKMFNKIEAEISGVISARFIDNGTPVEYDQSLFIIDTGE